MVPGRTVVAVGLILAGSAGSAPSQQAVPGVTTEVVRLDAVVTDGDGNLVRDLSREDFELRDDGKVQQLTHFVFVGKGDGRVGQGGGAAVATLPAPRERGGDPRRPNARSTDRDPRR